MRSLILAIAACAFLTIANVASAQTPPPAPDSQTQRAPAPIAGDLVNVDSTAMTLTVKKADGTEETLKYTDATEVQGAKDGAAGLANAKNSKVTVHFTEKDRTKTATRIIVQQAKQ